MSGAKPTPLDLDITSDVYLTDEHKSLEQQYCVHLAKKVHQIAIRELDRSEENLFLLFFQYDKNMDGCISRSEMKALLENVANVTSESEVDEVVKKLDANSDNNITFLELLKWWSGQVNGAPEPGGNTLFNLNSVVVGMFGSGYMGCDQRWAELNKPNDLPVIKQNIMGYKRIIVELQNYKVNQKLEVVRKFESETGLVPEVLQKYHDLLVAEFEWDMGLLFELFCSVDKSNNLLLEPDEMKELFRLLDTTATDEDIERYSGQICLKNGSLTFGLFVAWWDAVCDGGLLADKDISFRAVLQTRKWRSNFVTYFSMENDQQATWRELAESPAKMRQLRGAYEDVLLEIRRYKSMKFIKEAERKWMS